jgi:hypothetical protein
MGWVTSFSRSWRLGAVHVSACVLVAERFFAARVGKRKAEYAQGYTYRGLLISPRLLV